MFSPYYKTEKWWINPDTRLWEMMKLFAWLVLVLLPDRFQSQHPESMISLMEDYVFGTRFTGYTSIVQTACINYTQYLGTYDSLGSAAGQMITVPGEGYVVNSSASFTVIQSILNSGTYFYIRNCRMLIQFYRNRCSPECRRIWDLWSISRRCQYFLE